MTIRRLKSDDMDKIDIRDLRVDNWIYHKDCPIPLQVSGVKDNEVYLKHSFTPSVCSIDEIKPIPLTTEILEDRSCPQVSIYWDDRKTEETGENWYEVMIHTKSCAAELHIRYVHELQHALRLCGVDKEITI